MIKTDLDKTAPFVMQREEAAAFLRMTEKELIVRSKEPGFPHHSSYWGHWWFATDDLADWKAANQQKPSQLGLDLVEERRSRKEDEDIEKLRADCAAMLARFDSILGKAKRRRAPTPRQSRQTFASA